MAEDERDEDSDEAIRRELDEAKRFHLTAIDSCPTCRHPFNVIRATCGHIHPGAPFLCSWCGDLLILGWDGHPREMTEDEQAQLTPNERQHYAVIARVLRETTANVKPRFVS